MKEKYENKEPKINLDAFESKICEIREGSKGQIQELVKGIPEKLD